VKVKADVAAILNFFSRSIPQIEADHLDAAPLAPIGGCARGVSAEQSWLGSHNGGCKLPWPEVFSYLRGKHSRLRRIGPEPEAENNPDAFWNNQLSPPTGMSTRECLGFSHPASIACLTEEEFTLQILYPHCCGLDVHKKSITGCCLWV
jgi:hypothetical protein